MSQIRTTLSRPWVTKAAYTSAVTLQIACTIHLINEHVFEIRNSTGASMLPTLAPEGDFLLQLRLPFSRFVSSLTHSEKRNESHPYYATGRGGIGGSKWSKTDQAQGTGLKVGDLVVALSPFDPSRTVCKRVIGLPGDTVALDPRMRPVPELSWRGRKPKKARVKEDEGLGKMVRFEELLADVGVPSTTTTAPTTTTTSSEIDLLQSMDTTSTPSDNTHNTAASAFTYTRSKGDVQYITIPQGHVWLAGDNMANSTDSRHYGPVPLGMVRGKVLARVWPNPRWLTGGLAVVD